MSESLPHPPLLPFDPSDLAREARFRREIYWRSPLAAAIASSTLYLAVPAAAKFFTWKNPLKITKSTPEIARIRAMTRKFWLSLLAFSSVFLSFAFFVNRHQAEVARQVEKYESLLSDFVDYKAVVAAGPTQRDKRR